VRKQRIVLFKLEPEFDEDTTIRLHIAADQRYKLFLNSVREGAGNERGNVDNWYFESYDRSNEKTVADITKKTIDAGGNSVSFRLATEKEFNNAVEELVDDGRFYEVIRRTSLKSFFDVNKASLMYYGNPDQYVLTFIIEV
jgi:hypothetical protein